VRYLAFMVSGFFAGIAGGLAALNFEIVTAEVVGAARSGAYLLFVFLGGATFFIGPILGAVLMVVALVLLSELTAAWLLYLGLTFLFMVMFAPGGLAGLVMMNLRVAAFGKLRALATGYLALVGSGLVAFGGGAAMIEMLYHLQLNQALGPKLPFLGATLDASRPDAWFGAVFALITGAGLFELSRRHFAEHWGGAQEEIEKEIKHREAL
jgi:branched-chain amino acid transport system permease protein